MTRSNKVPSDAAGPGSSRAEGANRLDPDRPLPGAMPDRLPETAPAPDFDAKSNAKILLRSVRAGALATIDRNTGHPFGSLVNVATDSDGSPLILISRLSSHTANLETDSRASVLLATTGKGDPLAHPRLTVLGRFAKIAHDAADEVRLRRRFLARHPKAELYAGFADFALWRMTIESAHLNAGFARAADLTAADVMTIISGAGDLLDSEPSAIAHMNGDHADALALYATKLLGAAAGPWRMTGLDPDGLDLACGDAVLRLDFPQRITNAGRLREVLADLAKRARGS
jgi:heme oxygenase (biliverdin-IX-beta and delta-forming)